MYFAIIGDIVNSKALPNRKKTQLDLKSVLDSVNKEYVHNIASSFTITLGDEFQGLLLTPNYLLEIIDIIRFKMYPIELRFGVGIGEMRTEIIKEQSIGSDGPAYWAAREAITYVHDVNDYGISKICFREYEDGNKSENNAIIESVNKMLNLCDRIENKWTDTQASFVRSVILKHKYDDVSQRTLAGEQGLTPQAINQKMKSTGITAYTSAKQSIQFLLKVMYEIKWTK